jgi:hypothetical protein
VSNVSWEEFIYGSPSVYTALVHNSNRHTENVRYLKWDVVVTAMPFCICVSACGRGGNKNEEEATPSCRL